MFDLCILSLPFGILGQRLCVKLLKHYYLEQVLNKYILNKRKCLNLKSSLSGCKACTFLRVIAYYGFSFIVHGCLAEDAIN